MKKITRLFVLISSMITTGANAQFFERTTFVGALGKDASKDWTAGWTEWNPKQANYPAVDETTTLNATSTGKIEIANTVTLNATKVYLLKGIIVVKNGGKLVIPAGTIIRAEADVNATPKNYATIVVERGGQIEINGTSTNPVVFTSNKAAGSRDRGDWGGIVLCGDAPNNQGTDVQVEGFNNVTFDNALAKHGGTDNNDNSGSITYCRLEFGGLAFEANKEINGLTFGSVGKGTKIEGVQISFSGDDGFEWFGGNVMCKKLVSYKITDDDFDTDYGYSGAVQFGIAVKDTAYYDLSYNAPGGSTSEGFESDNDGGGSGKTPYTNAVFSNMTMIGPVPVGATWNDLGTVQKAAYRRGARIRRNSRISVVNSIFMGYRNFVFFDGDSTIKASGVFDSIFPSNMAFQNNLIVNSGSAFSPATSTANGLVEVGNAAYLSKCSGWLQAASNNNNINPVAYTSKTVLEDPQNPTAPNFRPVSASPALADTGWTHPRVLSFGTWDTTGSWSVRSMDLTRFEIFPNPATSVLNVTLGLKTNTEVTMTLVDLTGKAIVSGEKHILRAGDNQISLSLTNVNNGIYLLLIQSNDGAASSRIIVNN